MALINKLLSRLPKRNTFAFRLNFYVVTLISLTALIIFSSYYLISRNMLLESVEENARNLTEKNANKINAVIAMSAKIPYNLALLLEVRQPSVEELYSVLREVVERNDEVYGSAVAFQPYSFQKNEYFFAPYVYKKDGEIIQTDLNDPGYEYFYQDWYQIPRYLQKPVWSEPYFDEGGGNILMTTYSVPFFKTENNKKVFWGVITIDIALDWLDNIVSSIKIFDNGFAFVATRAGNIVTHPNSSYIMNESIFSIAEENSIPELRSIGKDMIKGMSGFKEVEHLYKSGDAKIYYTPLSNQWSLAVMFPEDELYSRWNNLSLMIIVLGLLGLSVIIFTITAVSKKLTKPLTLFAAAAHHIGAGRFNAELPEVTTKDEIGDLNHSFKSMQVQLNNYIENLKFTTQAKEKMESELRIAHQIQMDMIPKIFPPFPDREDIDLFAFLEPAREVGGDLYDFFFIDDERLVIVIGDVAGKGVPASLFMAVTRTLIRSKMEKSSTSSSIIDQINRDLIQNNHSKLFVTLLLGIIDLRNKTVEYTNAGHNLPYILTKEGELIQLKDKHGMALGLFELKPYASSKISLNKGDKLILYTDGVNEAMDAENNLYDYERFESLLHSVRDLSVNEATAAVLEDIKKFTHGAAPSDDITLMILALK